MATKMVLGAMCVMALISTSSAGCFSLPPCGKPQCSYSALNIPFPLPASIPVGTFCKCQKIAIKPSLYNAPTPVCASAPACAPAPVPAPAPVYAPAPVCPTAVTPTLCAQGASCLPASQLASLLPILLANATPAQVQALLPVLPKLVCGGDITPLLPILLPYLNGSYSCSTRSTCPC